MVRRSVMPLSRRRRAGAIWESCAKCAAPARRVRGAAGPTDGLSLAKTGAGAGAGAGAGKRARREEGKKGRGQEGKRCKKGRGARREEGKKGRVKGARTEKKSCTRNTRGDAGLRRATKKSTRLRAESTIEPGIHQ